MILTDLSRYCACFVDPEEGGIGKEEGVTPEVKFAHKMGPFTSAWGKRLPCRDLCLGWPHLHV